MGASSSMVKVNEIPAIEADISLDRTPSPCPGPSHAQPPRISKLPRPLSKTNLEHNNREGSINKREDYRTLFGSVSSRASHNRNNHGPVEHISRMSFSETDSCDAVIHRSDDVYAEKTVPERHDEERGQGNLRTKRSSATGSHSARVYSGCEKTDTFHITKAVHGTCGTDPELRLDPEEWAFTQLTIQGFDPEKFKKANTKRKPSSCRSSRRSSAASSEGKPIEKAAPRDSIDIWEEELNQLSSRSPQPKTLKKQMMYGTSEEDLMEAIERDFETGALH